MKDKHRITEWMNPRERFDSEWGDQITAQKWCEIHVKRNPGIFRIVPDPKGTGKIALERVTA